MASEAEDLERLLRALKESAEEIEDFDEIVKDVNKSYNRWMKDLKESQSGMKSFKEFLGGVKKPLIDATEEMKKFDKAIKEATDAQEDLIAVELESKKAKLESTIAQKNAGIGLRNFAIGMGSATKSLLSGVNDFIKGLQGSAEGTELTGQAAEKAAGVVGEVATAFGGLLEAIGPLMVFMKKLPYVGAALTVLGVALEALGPTLTDGLQAGLKILNTEVEKTKKSFKEITGTGAEFAGGMTELRAMARMAGLDIAQLSNAVKNNVEALSNMGLGLSDATRRFTGISRELRNSELGIQLRKLGLGVEEQGEAALLTAAYLNSAGKLREKSDYDVAVATVAYTKDLKILQGVTGEDAKKAMEKARLQAMEADLYAEAMRVGGPNAVLRLQKILGATPEAFKKGTMEFLSSGGRAIADQATLVAMNYNPMLQKQLDKSLEVFQNGNISAEDAQQEILRANEQTAQYARENADKFQPIAFGARFTEDGLLRGATDIFNAAILYSSKAVTGTADKVKEDVNKAAENMAPLDANIAKLDEDVQKLKSALGAELTGAIAGYTGALITGGKHIKDFGDTLKSVKDAMANNFGVKAADSASAMAHKSSWYGHLAGKTAEWAGYGGVAGAVASPYVAGAGALPGALIGGAGGLTKGLIDLYKGEYASGGVASGPLSGYSATLHGTEAVVPLPDNRSIPVTVTKDAESKQSNPDVMQMNDSLNRQSTLLNEILRTLKDSNNIQSGILQASY